MGSELIGYFAPANYKRGSISGPYMAPWCLIWYMQLRDLIVSGDSRSS